MSKVIIWDADDRELPTVGVAKKGDEFACPDRMAKSFVEQGLATYPPTAEKQEKIK